LSIEANRVGFNLWTETEPVSETLFLIRNWTMDNVQKVNYCTKFSYDFVKVWDVQWDKDGHGTANIYMQRARTGAKEKLI
jgi:hypothetical protein